MKKDNSFAASVVTILCAFTLTVAVLGALGLNRPVHAADWFDSNWSHRKKVTIDHTKVADDLTNFPVLIGLSRDSHLVSYTQADGDDILFTGSNGTTKLDHEVEKYDGGTGELLAWVRIPNLSSAADTEIYLYYGNPSAANQENATEVWDEHFHGVWHLSESASPSNDSTSYGNHGTEVNSPSYGAVGVINGCVDLGSRDTGVKVIDNDSLDVGSSDFTVSVWYRKVGRSAWYSNCLVFHKWKFGGESGINEWIIVSSSSGQDNTPVFCVECDGNKRYRAEGDTDAAGDTWHYVVGVRDGTTLRLYVNGVQQRDVQKGVSGSVNNVGRDLYLAYYPDFPDHSLDGSVDEARISFTARSAEWIQTCYANQVNPSSFIKLGDPEPKGMP